MVGPGRRSRHNKITQENIYVIKFIEKKTRSGVHTKRIIAKIWYKTIICRHNTAILYKYYHTIRREQKKNVFLNDFNENQIKIKSSEISFQVSICAKEEVTIVLSY